MVCGTTLDIWASRTLGRAICINAINQFLLCHLNALEINFFVRFEENYIPFSNSIHKKPFAAGPNFVGTKEKGRVQIFARQLRAEHLAQRRQQNDVGLIKSRAPHGANILKVGGLWAECGKLFQVA